MTEFNKYQTSIEDLNLGQYDQEIQEQFYDFIDNVPFIKNLISPNRKYASQLPRDEKGRIIVDVTNPHILVDMDYFRQAAIKFERDGRYCDYRPNPNPNSAYGKWIREEVRRCYEGMVRESDGEWITGDYYFFLNYCPMLYIETDSEGNDNRVIGFPKVWEGHYLFTHYIYQARRNKGHAFMLSSRARGKSFLGAALMAKRFVLGESTKVNKKVQCYITASDKKYLTGGDQTLDKFVFDIDHCALYTQFPARKLINSINDMQWTSGYKDLDTGTNMGTLNSVIGISSSRDESKLRGTRGVLYVLEEAGTFSKLLNTYGNMRHSVEQGKKVYGTIVAYGCVCAGTKVWTNDGKYINIEELRKEDGIIGYDNSHPVKNTIGTLLEPKYKPCIRIEWEHGGYLECSADHPILKQVVHTPRVPNTKKRYRTAEEVWTRADELKIGDRILEGRYIGAFGEDTLQDARLIGMLIGDGSYGYDNTPKFASEDEELLNYIKQKYDWGLSRYHITKEGRLYQEIRVKGICPLLRKVGIFAQVKKAKRLPDKYQTLTEEDTKLLLAGLFDTDGCISKSGEDTCIQLVQSNKEILEQIALLLRKFGIFSTIVENKPNIKPGRKDKNPWYILRISGRINVQLFYNNIPLIQKRKVDRLQKWYEWSNAHPIWKERCYDIEKVVPRTIRKIEDIGTQIIYNLSAEQSHTYLANNIITHNTAGDSESDFSAMQTIMYSPKGYNVYALRNVYDKEGFGRDQFVYFFPGYMNYEGYYNKDGVSDITAALLEILKDRYTVKYNTNDISAITKRIAESPIVPQEAVLRTRGNLFPTAQLNERIAQLDGDDNAYSDVITGDMVMDKDGNVSVRTSQDVPIRDFPLKEDDPSRGCVEIFQIPQTDKSGRIPNNRYIAGNDPYDNDQAESKSLGSVFVLDLFTDKIVAEYTGRPMYAEEFYETTRLLCMYYNAKCLYESNKKGLFAYFSKMNSVHLLADTPEYLRDRQLIKYSGFGSNQKGVNASLAINNFANQLIKDWLLKPVVTVVKEDGQDKEITVSNLYFIRNRALLRELAMFNPDINVDRVRALGMVMLYREEKMIMYGGEVNEQSGKTPDNYLGNDEFFLKNYNWRFNISV